MKAKIQTQKEFYTFFERLPVDDYDFVAFDVYKNLKNREGIQQLLDSIDKDLQIEIIEMIASKFRDASPVIK